MHTGVLCLASLTSRMSRLHIEHEHKQDISWNSSPELAPASYPQHAGLNMITDIILRNT